MVDEASLFVLVADASKTLESHTAPECYDRIRKAERVIALWRYGMLYRLLAKEATNLLHTVKTSVPFAGK